MKIPNIKFLRLKMERNKIPTYIGVSVVSVIILISLYLIFSLYGILDVGIEYDELLAINASLGCPNKSIFLQFGYFPQNFPFCLPIMLSPYIGGLLALPYAFYFLIIPPSPLSFRLFNVFIGLISLLIIYISCRKKWGNSTSLLVLLFLIFDAQLLFTLRLDKPTAIPFFVKSLMLMLVLNMESVKNRRFFLALGFLAGALTYIKFDSVFLLAALFLGMLLHFYQNKISFKDKLTGNRNNLVYCLVGISAGLAPVGIYLLLHGREFAEVFLNYSSAKLSLFVSKAGLFFHQLAFPDFISYVFEDVGHVGITELSLSVILVLSWFAAAYISIKRKKYSWLGFAFFAFFIFYIFYKGLIFSHHRLLIYPLPQILLALALGIKSLKKLVPIIALLYILLFMLSYDSFTEQSKKTCGVGSFTCAIYPLFEEISDEKKEIFIGDWGISTQLILLSSGNLKLNEASFILNREDPDTSLLQNSLENCHTIVIRPKEQSKFRLADRKIRENLNAQRKYSMESIKDKNGIGRFEVYSCEDFKAPQN